MSIIRTMAIGALAIALPLIGVGPAAAEDAQGVSDTEIRLGIMSALTGPVAAYGTAMQYGTYSMFNLVNERGGINGRQINLIGEDNAMSTPQAMSVARRMTSEGIFALVNSGGTPQVDALRPYLIEQNNVAIFGSYGGLREWFDPPKPGMFGIPVVAEDGGTALGRWAGKDGHEKLLVVHIEAASFQRGAEEVVNGFETSAPDGTVELMGVKLPTTDYAPIVIRIGQIEPDAIVVMVPENETVLLAKELENQNMSIPLYVWTPSVSQTVIELGGSAVEGMKGVSWTVSPTDETPEVEEYREALAKYYPGEKPDFISLYTFGAAKVFAEALQRMEGDINMEELTKALYSMDGFETGLLAPVTFSPERHLGTTEVYAVEIVDGKWQIGQLIDTADPNW